MMTVAYPSLDSCLEAKMIRYHFRGLCKGHNWQMVLTYNIIGCSLGCGYQPWL